MNAAIKTMISLLLCLCVAAVFLTGCSKQENQGEEIQNYSELTQTESFPVKMELDEEYIIQTKPRRLVVLSADLVQALEDIGAASLISGVSADAPKDAAVSGAKVCGTALDADIEQIVQANPDWVLVSSQMRKSQKEELKSQNIEVITFSRPNDLEEIQERYRQLFTLCYGLDGNKKAEDFLKNYREKLDAILKPAAEYARLGQSKSAIYLAKPDYTMATGETFEGRLLSQMGLRNIGDFGSRWNYPEEELEQLDPDIIFYDETLSPESISQSEIYANSQAVRSNALVAVDFSAVRLQGMPMLEEISKMAQAAYPQAYGK